MTAAIVFAGPSLWRVPLPPMDGIELRPPAACGDVLRAARGRPRAIGLIDGVFETGPSVWHKEILAVMADGVAVFGAASLGAIRAAELHAFGMIGVGSIFDEYRVGTLERDDAVMVSHAPAALGYRPLTVALVDVIAAISGWPPDDRAAMTGIAADIGFRDRTWSLLEECFTAQSGRPMPPVDRDASRKGRDAEMLMRLLAEGRFESPPHRLPPPETPWLRSLRNRV